MGQTCPTFTNYNVVQIKICGYASLSLIVPWMQPWCLQKLQSLIKTTTSYLPKTSHCLKLFKFKP